MVSRHPTVAGALAACLISSLSVAQTKAPLCPNVLIVFDASGSMGNSTTGVDGGTASRYEVAKQAVAELTSGSAAQQMRFGLELFGTSDNGNCGISPSTCSYPNPLTCGSVTCDFGQAANIADVLDDLAGPQGSTPTAGAIIEAKKRPDMQDTSRGRYILLVTDGQPSGRSSAGTLNNTLHALTDIRVDAGVKSFVLAFNVPSNLQTQLNQMADAGGTARQAVCDTENLCYYDATNGTELRIALESIVSTVVGELGSPCDETCYGQGCPAGQVCTGGTTCVPDQCANVQCAQGVCVEGQCKSLCDVVCPVGQRCDNGQCANDAPCAQPCTGVNEVCVNGQCVENYCSGKSSTITCPDTHVCYHNGCQLKPGAQPDAGTGRDGGTGSTEAGAGCCSGAPGAFSVFAMVLGAALLLAMRRRSRAR